LVQTVRPLRQLLAFPDDNTGKDIWNRVSQGLILYRIRLNGGAAAPVNMGQLESDENHA
jgi:hypothetical protein